jgi:hypothetical protein
MRRELKSQFKGTSAQLMERLSAHRNAGWPATTKNVTELLSRNSESLRRAGWVVTDDDGRNKAKSRIWTIIPPGLDTPSA